MPAFQILGRSEPASPCCVSQRCCPTFLLSADISSAGLKHSPRLPTHQPGTHRALHHLQGTQDWPPIDLQSPHLVVSSLLVSKAEADGHFTSCRMMSVSPRRGSPRQKAGHAGAPATRLPGALAEAGQQLAPLLLNLLSRASACSLTLQPQNSLSSKPAPQQMGFATLLTLLIRSQHKLNRALVSVCHMLDKGHWLDFWIARLSISFAGMSGRHLPCHWNAVGAAAGLCPETAAFCGHG